MAKIQSAFIDTVATIGEAIRTIAQGEGALLCTIIDMRNANKGRPLAWGEADDSMSLHYACNLMLDALFDAGDITEATAKNYKSRLKGALTELPYDVLCTASVVSWNEVMRAITEHRVTQREAEGKGAGKPGRKAASKKGDKGDKPAATNDTSLAGLVLTFTNARAALPKFTANGEALTLIDQALALLRGEVARDAKSKAAPI